MLKLFIQTIHWIALIVVVSLSLVGITFIGLSLTHRIPVSLVVLVDRRMSLWLYGAGFLLILTTLFLRREERPSELNESWRRRIRALAVALALIIALDAIFGWSSQIKSFGLRMIFEGLLFAATVVIVGSVVFLSKQRNKRGSR